MSNTFQTLAFWRGQLPHWEVAGAYYFITLHLAEALPLDAVKRIRETSAKLSNPDLPQHDQLQRFIFREMERWLDKAPRTERLAVPEVARIVAGAIHFRERQGIWTVPEYVIMPNHLHMLMKLRDGRLKQVMEQFKRWTGVQAAALLNDSKKGFWQTEWFDHWIRTPEQYISTKRYIRRNVERAGLAANYLDWPYGSWNKSP